MHRNNRRRPSRACTLLFGLALALVFGLLGFQSSTALAGNDASAFGGAHDTELAMGEVVADQLSQTIGVGLSPAFGLAVIGLFDIYVRELPPEHRSWYHAPWIVFPLCLLLIVIVIKDVLGAPVGPLKQPADAAEFMVDHGAGLMGLLAVVGFSAEFLGPTMGGLAYSAYETVIPTAHAATGGAADGVFGALGAVLASTVGALSYAGVWIMGHAWSALVFLNPFSMLDPFLKGARIVVIGGFAGICALSPWLGAVACVLFIAFAWLVAGYCLRWSTLGSVVAWEMLLRRGRGDVGDARGVLAFSSTGVEGVPLRTLGRISEGDGGGFAFHYRPLLVLPSRSCPTDLSQLHVVTGTVHPTLGERDDGKGPRHFALPPRYRGKEEDLVIRLGLAGVGSSSLVRGWRAGVEYWRGLFSGQREPA